MATQNCSTIGAFHWVGKRHHRHHRRRRHQHRGRHPHPHPHPHHHRRHPRHDQRLTHRVQPTERALRGMRATRTAAPAKAAAAQLQSRSRSSTRVVAATSPPPCQHVYMQRPGPARRSQAAAPLRSIPRGRALAFQLQSCLAVPMLVRSSAIHLGMCGSRLRRHHHRHHHCHRHRCWSQPAVHAALGRRRKAGYSSWAILSPSAR